MIRALAGRGVALPPYSGKVVGEDEQGSNAAGPSLLLPTKEVYLWQCQKFRSAITFSATET
jgi:hypothetical protein